ncbi:hypothetical protein E4U42_002688 [Claviceps africana]|uniref:Uncharacterized protein n=1 Tax=Claviceps africana TaxID=83212 RepID=A0A8K0J7L9_9HYPO|nr:hypothetical protein E4U42_002688 [Claviceps africana]
MPSSPAGAWIQLEPDGWGERGDCMAADRDGKPASLKTLSRRAAEAVRRSSDTRGKVGMERLDMTKAPTRKSMKSKPPCDVLLSLCLRSDLVLLVLA